MFVLLCLFPSMAIHASKISELSLKQGLFVVGPLFIGALPPSPLLWAQQMTCLLVPPQRWGLSNQRHIAQVGACPLVSQIDRGQLHTLHVSGVCTTIPLPEIPFFSFFLGSVVFSRFEIHSLLRHQWLILIAVVSCFFKNV